MHVVYGESLFNSITTSNSYPNGYIMDTLTLENKNIYEIYHRDNTYNFNSNFNDYSNTQRRRPISKLTNNHADTVSYIYRDLNDNQHEVCESEIFEVFEKDYHTIPNNYNQAQVAFEDVLTGLNPHPTIPNRNIRIFNSADDILVQNNLTVTPTDLFQMINDYRILINAGNTDAQIVASMAAQTPNTGLIPNQNQQLVVPQNVQTLVNNSTATQRQRILVIDNVVDQTSYAVEGVDARFTCTYPLGVVTSGDYSRRRRRYYRNMNIGIPIRLIDAQFEPLVALANDTANQPALNYTSGTLTIGFSYRASRRRYANPDLFASFIGALAQLNYAHNTAHVVSSGFSFPDATCYPSTSHVNGVACDTLYFNQIGSLDVYQQPFIDALWDFGFHRHFIGQYMSYTHGTPDSSGIHQGHLHSDRLHHNNRNFIENIL